MNDLGNYLQVGGIKDKVLAAHRAGMCKVILPKRNKKDLQEVPFSVKVRGLLSLILILNGNLVC